jgi:hypothetical protein
MTLTRPFGTDAAYPNAADFRKGLAGIVTREGVFPDPITTAAAGIAYAGTGWGVNARPFVAAVRRGGAPYSLSYGPVLVANDGVVNNAWTISAAPGSGSRIDLLCVRARDVTQGDSASGAPTDGPGGVARTGISEFVTVTGTASGSPVAPAVPAGYTEVGRVTTPSGAVSTAGSTFAHVFPFAQIAGGIIYARTIAERDALVTPLAGDLCYVTATSQTFEYVDATAGWVAMLGKPTLSAITFSGIYSAGATTPRVLEHGGRVYLDGIVSSTSATFGGNTAYAFGTIPAAKAPASTRYFPTMINTILPALITVTSAGALSITPSAGFTNTLGIALDMCSWPDKRLA